MRVVAAPVITACQPPKFQRVEAKVLPSAQKMKLLTVKQVLRRLRFSGFKEKRRDWFRMETLWFPRE